MIPKTSLCLVAVVACLSVPAGPGFAQAPVPSYVVDSRALASASTSELRTLVDRFTLDREAINRSWDTPYSPERAVRLKAFLAGWRTQLGQMAFEKLSQDGKVDFLLLLNRIGREEARLARDEKLLAETAPLLPFATRIIGLDDARRRMGSIDAKAAASSMAALAGEIARTRKSIEDGLGADAGPGRVRTSRVIGLRSAQMAVRLERALTEWFSYYNGYDPLFTWWAAQPFKKADDSLKAYAKFLRESVVGARDGEADPIVGDPIGRDALRADLAFEMIPYSPDELVAIGEREFAWCEAEMKKAARDMGFGDDWKAALEKVKTLHVEPGRQSDLIRDQALEAIAFLEKRDLVTIPPLARDMWRIEMMSPARQKVNPFFTGGEVISVSFPTDGMEHEDKLMSLRGNNIHFARATVHHELVPGHHLQGFMADRYNPHRQLFSTPFYGEGWSLYWEMLLWDLGFPQSAENRVGMLFWRMHRAARIIFSLKFHLGQMTPQECIDFLVDRVGHERANATAEVRRSFNGSYPPLYQAAYMIGGLQLRALSKELVGSGRLTWRQFHDAVLQANEMPIEMLRALLTRQPLTPAFGSSWKF
ncbi:MAG TPA: DUF885 family protein [Vicinamibacterales bacterium]|jgi:uncharacterized protein (DUF885 family)